ncbi:MAG: PilZ domain-containing protein [Desulforhopalus sp.]
MNKLGKVRADVKRNRLYITLSCDPSKKVLAKVYTDIRFCVADLKPGFDVITDLSLCTIGHLNGISTLRKIMDYLIANQVGEVVRVLGKKSLLFKQFIKFRTIFQGYSVAYVATLDEAEDKLINSARRNSLRFCLHRQQIKYRINQEEGQGQIIDISLSGCAVEAATICPTPNTKISFIISIHEDHDTLLSFTIAAKVVRVKDDMFAAQFMNLDNVQKGKLYNCLAFEIRSDT